MGVVTEIHCLEVTASIWWHLGTWQALLVTAAVSMGGAHGMTYLNCTVQLCLVERRMMDSAATDLKACQLQGAPCSRMHTATASAPSTQTPPASPFCHCPQLKSPPTATPLTPAPCRPPKAFERHLLDRGAPRHSRRLQRVPGPRLRPPIRPQAATRRGAPAAASGACAARTASRCRARQRRRCIRRGRSGSGSRSGSWV